MVDLVKIETFKEQIGITWHDQDARLDLALSQAHGIVLKHIKVSPDQTEWTHDSVPANVGYAITLVAKALFVDAETVMTQTVRDLLVGFRDPTLA